MKILAGLIRHQLRLESNKFGHCAVYEKELQRVWPLNEKDRKTKIEQFAKEHGFRLAYYRHGFCAIFEELPRFENSHHSLKSPADSIASLTQCRRPLRPGFH
jgi:hypothetical protein